MAAMGSDQGEQRNTPALGCACAAGNEFGEREARRDLAAYRRRGPDRTTAWLIEGLAAGPAARVDGLTVLDIGAGIGAAHLGLLDAGAAHALDVDGSPAYVAVAREEAERRGRSMSDRIDHRVGDFVELAPTVDPADLVLLDRVVCCYPDMRALVRLSVDRARLRYGLVYPRDAWWIRAGSRLFNAFGRLTRSPIRIWIHRSTEVDAIVRAAGFAPRFERTTLVWQVVVYERA